MPGTRRFARLVVAVACAGLPVVACGGGGGGGATHPAGGAPAPVTRARPAGARIGATLRVRARGATLAVRLARVIDPLRGSGASLLPGTRVVGVVVEIANRGPGTYDSSSTGDVSIVPSSGTAAAAYASRGPCATQDRDFDNQIAGGETRAGCVAFTLDSAARLALVRFAANAGGAGVGTWRAR